MRVLGTCSICKGSVVVPEMWGGRVPPIPTCQWCQARARQPYGTEIAMQPAGTQAAEISQAAVAAVRRQFQAGG